MAALAFVAILLITDLPYFFYQRSGGKKCRRTVVVFNIIFVVFGLVVLTGVLRNAV
jgi:low temperature requirement protein LtrA